MMMKTVQLGKGRGSEQLAWPIAGAVLAAGAAGLSVSVSPVVAAALVGIVLALAIALFFDVLGIGVVLTAAIPWLIVLSEVLPRLTLTLASGAAAIVIWQIARPQSDGSKASLLLRVGLFLFVAPLVISVGRQGLHVGLTEAAKYAVFPLMVLAITEATNHRDLFLLRSVALWSGAAAVAVNLFLGLTGIANIGYYGTGEILGLGSEHILALLAGSITAAALATSLSLRWTPVISIAAIATVATGVRAALPGLALAGIARMITGRVRFRMMLLVVVAVTAIFVSGAAHVVEARFHRGESLGEFHSLSAFGSGRGAIYAAAIKGWAHASPVEWLSGTGIGSILRFSQARLGQSFVGHSDLVGVGVELGILGLLGLILLWRVLIARVDSRLPLLVLGFFSLFNGILEYSGPVIIGLLLTVGAVRRVERAPAREAARVELGSGRESFATSHPALRGPA